MMRGSSSGDRGKGFRSLECGETLSGSRERLLLRLHGAVRTAEERANAAPGKLQDGYKEGDAIEICYALRDEDEVVVLK